MDTRTKYIIGFTGTQLGCVGPQRLALEATLSDWRPHVLHAVHGCCVGADAEFDDILVRLGVPRVLRPSDIEHKSVACERVGVVVARYAPAEPLARNRRIVDDCNILIACPRGPEEVRSGTWSTVRYARKRGRLHLVIWPDGTFAASW